MNFNVFIILGIFLGIQVSSLSKAESDSAIANSKSLKWLAFGDLRGHLEPCGCDPRSDLGSVQRLEAYLRRERMMHPDVLVFHLGNDFAMEGSDLARRKNAAIAEAMKLMRPTASLFNKNEILDAKNVASASGLPYVLSNYTSTLPPGVRSSIAEGPVAVYGFVEPTKGHKNLEAFSDRWLKKAIAPGKSKRILLFSGAAVTLKKIGESGLFDAIIASNTIGMDKQFGDEERRDESKLIAYRDSKQEVLMVPVGGQGVIRSPALQLIPPAMPISSMFAPTDKAASGSSFLGSSSLPSSESKLTIPAKRTFVKWLDPTEEVGASAEINAVIAQYRNVSSAAMDTLVKQRMADLASSPFAGAEVCQACHASSHKKLQESKHASAFATIKKAGRDSDPECVSCHVLGFSSKGGFVSEAASPKFANVQCESCHGPRKAHAENPDIKTKPTAKASDACAECHTPPHSPRFNSPEYWKKIEHK